MAYGLRCWDADGNKTLDVDENITRVRFQIEVLANVSSSVDLPDILGKSTIQLGLGLAEGRTPHVVTRNNTKILWRARGDTHFPSGSSLVQVFIYD